MKKQYLAPELSIDTFEASCKLLDGFGGASGPKPEPGAPQRGEGSSVKLTKMYI